MTVASSFTDAEIVEFAQRWDPYGGPAPSEIFLHFGCDVEAYQNRLRSALNVVVDTDSDRRNRLIEYTRRSHSVDETRWVPE